MDSQYGLGRLPSPEDARDWTVDRLLAMIKAGIATPVVWEDPVVLQQGGTNHCVGFGSAGFCAAAEAQVPANPAITDADGHRIYYEAKIYDGEPKGEDGSTVRSGAKALLHDENIVAGYAFGTYDEAWVWVQTHGPVVIGIDWWTTMFTPDAQGVIRPGGSLAGGHCILWRGVDAGGRCVLRNSWGAEWGKGGDCYIEGSDLAMLLWRNGEACMMVQPAPAPPKPLFTDVVSGDVDAEGIAAVAWCAEKGYIRGYPDGTFHPYAALLRAHVSLIAQRAGLVPVSSWWADYHLATRGEVRQQWPSLTWTRTDWNDPLTRVQLCRLLMRGGEGV